MIEVQALSRRYGDLLAVNDVSCRVSDGEVVGLLGHNGAGKTTIMKMLAGYLEATSGSIVINGYSMASEPRLIQQQLGYLPENCPVYPDMTVVEYLAFRADLMNMPPAEEPGAIRAALANTGLEDRALQSIGTLSRGLRQRVGVAQAILHHPSIVILDEPTNGLDPEQIGHMRSLIKSLAEHATVIVSTHILSEVEATCERVLMMSKGRLVLDAKLEELNRTAALLVEVSDTGGTLSEALHKVRGVGHVQVIKPGVLRLETTDDWQRVAAAAATTVHDCGLALYRLTPEVRSLETVFREVNEKVSREVAHA